jgi:superfamily I DNA/RNA helicase
MTIQRAKNREFANVIVLWPHSATGSPEHLRRLLYNAITRAQSHCSVIVLGQGRLSAPPFTAAGG